MATRDLRLRVHRECIHEIFITKITFSRQIWQTTKILVLENFRLYGIYGQATRDNTTLYNLMIDTAEVLYAVLYTYVASCLLNDFRGLLSLVVKPAIILLRILTYNSACI